MKHSRKLPNEYKIIDGVVYITLYDKFHNPLTEKALMDESDYHLISDKRLVRSRTKTSTRIKVSDKITGKQYMLHRLITNAPDGMDVDHINGNTNDNRRCNLRICTRSENNMNSKKTKGIWYHKQNKKWIVEITANKVKKHIGCYNTIDEALLIRHEKEKEYFKSFAPVR